MKSVCQALHAAQFLAETACFAALSALLLLFPRAVSAGAAEGLRLCMTSLCGALLPFLVLSRLFLLRGLQQPLARRASFFTRRALGLPGVCAAAVAFSLCGGYPVGPAMTAELVQSGLVSPRKGRHMLLFCCGPGPAFAVSAVGAGMLNRPAAGAVLWAAVALSGLLCGVLTRPLFRETSKAVPAAQTPPERLPLAEALPRAAGEALQSMLLICGFVTLFSALLALLRALSLPVSVLSGAAALLEVTNACRALAGSVSLPVLAAVLAWGGVCTHCQIAPFLAAAGLPFSRFVLGRALHAGAAFGVCRLLLVFVRLPQGTIAGTQLRPAAGSPALSVCMLAMCVLLLCPATFHVRGRKGACNSGASVLQ